MRGTLVSISLSLLCGAQGPADGRRPRSIVGAIRWDAWHGDAGLDSAGPERFEAGKRPRLTPGLAVERSLGPKHWHYRLPFYAKVVGENRVEVRANSQEVMDREIAYASTAGLDYWAFLTYAPDSPMTIGLDLYLSSAHKAKMKFCVILHHIRTKPAAMREETARIVGYMRDPQYVTVLDGRPLVYAFQCRAGRAFYDGLLKAAADAGLKRPYLVNMGSCAVTTGFDAVSSYAGRGGRRAWDKSKAAGRKVVPSVSAGWDRRPRVENPVPWEGGGRGRPVTGGRRRTAKQAAAQIAAGVKSAINWNAANPEAGEADAVIIYAWNEFDEGGWICPTLSEGASRLDAIRTVLVPPPATTQPAASGDESKRKGTE